MKGIETIWFAFLAILFWILGGVLILAAALLVGNQVLGYLRDGYWTSISLLDVLRYYFANPWLDAPATWIGVWKIMSSVPAALISVGCGFVSIAAASALSDEVDKYR